MGNVTGHVEAGGAVKDAAAHPGCWIGAPPRGGLVVASAVETPYGRFMMASIGGGVVATRGPSVEAIEPQDWGRWLWPGADIAVSPRDHRAFHAQIRDYFAGKRRAFDLPLALDGTDLHLRAWLAATEVPYGKSLTYGDLAWEIGAPGAARAVGRAMALCPAPLLIPCHRIVGAGGKRCGSLESWERRQLLLDFEREQLLARGEHRGSGHPLTSSRVIG